MDAKIVITKGLLLLALCPANAQNEKIDTAQAVEEKEAFLSTSSRYLLGESKGMWLEKMKSRLTIAKREIGPFGLMQDPNRVIVKKNRTKSKPKAFLNAIKAMKINAVIAREQKFIIGSREFREGDAFPVVRGQRQFNIKIVDVKSEAIVFMNVDTGEHIQRNLNTLPPGMSRDTQLDAIPGVIPRNKKNISPLHLDSPTLPTSTTQGNN